MLAAATKALALLPVLFMLLLSWNVVKIITKAITSHSTPPTIVLRFNQRRTALRLRSCAVLQ